jgi:hypothetical protein
LAGATGYILLAVHEGREGGDRRRPAVLTAEYGVLVLLIETGRGGDLLRCCSQLRRVKRRRETNIPAMVAIMAKEVRNSKYRWF